MNQTPAESDSAEENDCPRSAPQHRIRRGWGLLVWIRRFFRAALFGWLALGGGLYLWLSLLPPDLNPHIARISQTVHTLTGWRFEADHLHVAMDGLYFQVAFQNLQFFHTEKNAPPEAESNPERSEPGVIAGGVLRLAPFAPLFGAPILESGYLTGARIDILGLGNGRFNIAGLPVSLPEHAGTGQEAIPSLMAGLAEQRFRPFSHLKLVQARLTLRAWSASEGSAPALLVLEGLEGESVWRWDQRLAFNWGAAIIQGTQRGDFFLNGQAVPHTGWSFNFRAQGVRPNAIGRLFGPEWIVDQEEGVLEASFSGIVEREGSMEFQGDGAARFPDGVVPFESRGQRNRDGQWTLEAHIDHIRLDRLGAFMADFAPLDKLRSPLSLAVSAKGGEEQIPTSIHWRLSGESGSLEWSPLFRWPLPITGMAAHGVITRTLDQDGWNLAVEAFELENDHTRAEGAFTLSAHRGESPFLDLRAQLSRAPTSTAGFYYPVAIMHPKLVSWLDNSLVHGAVATAKVRIRGPVDGIPFTNQAEADRHDWVFRIAGEVHGVDIHFFPDLPPVSDVDAELVFDGVSLSARIHNGDLTQAAHALQGNIRIPDMLRDPVVVIHLEGESNLAALWEDIIAHPRLGWDREVGLTGSRISGGARAVLDLTLPIQAVGDARFQAALDIVHAQLALPFLDNPIQGLQGRLVVDQNQLRLQSANARFQNIPFQADLQVRDFAEPDRTALILTAEGDDGNAHLAPFVAPLLGTDPTLLGPTPFEFGITLSPGQSRFSLDLTLDATQWETQDRPGWDKISGEPGEVRLTGELDPDESRLELAAVSVDLGNLSVQGQGVVGIGARRGAFQVSASDLQFGHSRGVVEIARTPTTGEQAQWSVVGLFDQLDLGSLLADSVPHSGGEDEGGVAPVESAAIIAWPFLDIDLSARRLLLANGKRGEDFEAMARIRPRSVQFDRLRLQQPGPRFHLLKEGWFRWEGAQAGSGPYAGRIRIESDDLGGLLAGLNRHQGLQGGQGVIDVTLSGVTPDGERLIDNLNGSGRIEASEGTVRRFHLLSSLLGLLSIQELPNLLVGDRPDLEGNGFFFRQLNGPFELENGRWRTEGLEITGPSMKLLVTGEMDLPRNELDLLVGIQPLQTLDRIINHVPLLGRLVSGSREAILETQFEVSGPWRNPDIDIRPVSSLAPGIVRDIINLPRLLLEMSENAESAQGEDDSGEEASQGLRLGRFGAEATDRD